MVVMRGFRMDPSITKQKLKPGTIRRIAGYARPYRMHLTLFLIATAVDAVITVVNPLLLRDIIDHGILGHDEQLVILLACAVAAVSIFDAVLGFVIRWFSARIGEGLIYDLRTQVFDHVQRQPIAFFTRAQTGSLVSRLDGDVVGAQQAITSTLSGVLSNLLSLVVILITLFYLSWLVSLIALVMIPLFILPARLVGRRMQRLTRESMQLNAEMGSTMTERFNVAGAMLVKLFGRPSRGVRRVRLARGQGPRHRRGHRHVRPGALHRAHAAGLDGDRRGLRPGRHDGHPRHPPDRHAGGPDHPARPGLRPDHLAVQRAGQRHDGPGQLRPGLRGARPQAARRGEAGRGGAARHGRLRLRRPGRRRPGDRVRRRVVPLPVGERGVARLAGIDRAAGAGAQGRRRPGCCTR